MIGLPFSRRRLKVVGALLLGLLLGGGGVAVPAVFAHAVPQSSVPAPNTILDSAPTELSITFNEPVVPALSAIRLLTQAGEELAVGPARATDAANTTLSASLPSLENGSYLVSWQALSAVDGHTTSGTFSFGVGIAELAATAGEVSVSAQLSPLSAAARWLLLTSIALLLGFFAFRLLVWNPIFLGFELEEAEMELDHRHARASLRLAWAGLALLLLGLALVFIDQSRVYNLFQPANVRTWIGTRFGSMALVRLLLAGAFGFLLARLAAALKREGPEGVRAWVWGVGLLLAIGLALANAATSHSAALLSDTLPAMAVDLAHVLAAGIWAGGLVYLALGLWQARRLASAGSRSWLSHQLVLAFSTVASLSVGVLLASGSYLAWQHVGSWTKLVGTAYGQALLLKVGLALAALTVAGANLLIIRPRLAAADEKPETKASAATVARFRRLASLEMGLALLLLLAAGILTELQRGKDAPLLADKPGELVVDQPAEELNVQLTIEPALVGQNRFDVYLRDAGGKAVPDASAVSFRFTFLGQSIGAAVADAQSQGEGHYRLEGNFISLIGPWQVEVTVRRPGAFDTFAPFRLEAGLGGNIRSLDSGGRLLERFANFMTLAGGLAAGAGLVLFALLWGFLAIKAAAREWQLVALLLFSLGAFWLGAFQLTRFFNTEFTPSKFLSNPILPDAESIASGQALFEQNCVTCHGPEGRGDGPGAANLSPPPADFGAGHTGTHPDGDLYYWIRNGIENSAMPAFGDQLSKEETWHLVNYVRRLSALSSQQRASQGFQP